MRRLDLSGSLEPLGLDLASRPAGLIPEPTPEPVCQRCGGAEYLRGDVTDPLDPRFSEIVPCPDCKAPALRAQRFARLLGESGIEPFRQETFEQRSPLPGQRTAFEHAQRFARQPEGLLWLYGTTGTGKTMLALCIGNALIAAGVPVLFREAPALLRHIKSTFDKTSSVKTDEVWDAVMTVECLILDEYGRANPTPWVNEHMFELLNHRWLYRLATVVTTNKSLESLDPAIASRIMDSDVATLVPFRGASVAERGDE